MRRAERGGGSPRCPPQIDVPVPHGRGSVFNGGLTLCKRVRPGQGASHPEMPRLRILHHGPVPHVCVSLALADGVLFPGDRIPRAQTCRLSQSRASISRFPVLFASLCHNPFPFESVCDEAVSFQEEHVEVIGAEM